MGPKIEAKSWNPSLEQSIFKIWEDNNLYVFSNTFTEKKPFVIDTPPPYPSGRPWHIELPASLCSNRHDRKNCPDERIQCDVSNRHR